jgi:type I restriction enzyme, S subunit
LNLSKVSNLPVPLPPLDEQRRIVAEIERRLSVAREAESAVDAGLVRARRLRQAVLRSAFEGRVG